VVKKQDAVSVVNVKVSVTNIGRRSMTVPGGLRRLDGGEGGDIMKRMRSATDGYGALDERYEYDAFGVPYQGDLTQGMNLGYTGKPYDVTTGLYNYGYRDYAPTIARFTTVDPVRDGVNWFTYVNNDPVNWRDPDGLFPVNILVGAGIGFVSSSIVEVGSRVLSGQSVTEAIYNTVHDPAAMTNIFVSTIAGAATSGLSSLAVKTATTTIRTTAAIGVNTIGREAITAVAINTLSGAVNAGVKDVTINALTNQEQNFMEIAKVMGEGAVYAGIASIGTQVIVLAGTNVSTYNYNGIERSVPHVPEWNGTAGVIGESVLPDAAGIVVELGKQAINCKK
jgi:RHS repeat-associated protein